MRRTGAEPAELCALAVCAFALAVGAGCSPKPPAPAPLEEAASPEPTPPAALALPFVPRAVWARGLARGPFTEHTISAITVHHTAVLAAPDVDGREQARGHTRAHLARGWSDLAYHFLIGPDGVVREGRPTSAVGDTTTGYDPTGHLLVTLEGNFEEQEPSPAQQESLVRLLAWGSSEFGVPPEDIGGHREHAATLCPGASLHAMLASGAIAERVRAALAGGVRLEPQDCVVAIDVGHSADRPGATSARGRPEYAFNADLAAALVSALQGAEHIDGAWLLDSRGLSLVQRAPAAADRGATLLLSIHHDSVQPRYLTPWQHEGEQRLHAEAFRGHSLFVSAQGAEPESSERLGRALGQALRDAGRVPTKHHAEAIEGEGRPWVDEDLGLHRFDGLAVLRTSPIPAVLLEAGVIVHRDEEALLASPEGRAALAADVVQGLGAFCGPGFSESGAAPGP